MKHDDKYRSEDLVDRLRYDEWEGTPNEYADYIERCDKHDQDVYEKEINNEIDDGVFNIEQAIINFRTARKKLELLEIIAGAIEDRSEEILKAVKELEREISKL